MSVIGACFFGFAIVAIAKAPRPFHENVTTKTIHFDYIPHHRALNKVVRSGGTVNEVMPSGVLVPVRQKSTRAGEAFPEQLKPWPAQEQANASSAAVARPEADEALAELASPEEQADESLVEVSSPEEKCLNDNGEGGRNRLLSVDDLIDRFFNGTRSLDHNYQLYGRAFVACMTKDRLQARPQTIGKLWSLLGIGGNMDMDYLNPGEVVTGVLGDMKVFVNRWPDLLTELVNEHPQLLRKLLTAASDKKQNSKVREACVQLLEVFALAGGQGYVCEHCRTEIVQVLRALAVDKSDAWDVRNQAFLSAQHFVKFRPAFLDEQPGLVNETLTIVLDKLDGSTLGINFRISALKLLRTCVKVRPALVEAYPRFVSSLINISLGPQLGICCIKVQPKGKGKGKGAGEGLCPPTRVGESLQIIFTSFRLAAIAVVGDAFNAARGLAVEHALVVDRIISLMSDADNNLNVAAFHLLKHFIHARPALLDERPQIIRSIKETGDQTKKSDIRAASMIPFSEILDITLAKSRKAEHEAQEATKGMEIAHQRLAILSCVTGLMLFAALARALYVLKHQQAKIQALEQTINEKETRAEMERISKEYASKTLDVAAKHQELYSRFLVASSKMTAEDANQEWAAAKNDFSRIKSNIDDLQKLDAEMLRALIEQFHADEKKWRYIQRINPSDTSGMGERLCPEFSAKVNRRQPKEQAPRQMLNDSGIFMTLLNEGESWPEAEKWQEVNAAYVDFSLINASWLKDYTFKKFENLLVTLNNASDIEDIERAYPSVSRRNFPDELCDPKYKLLTDASADVTGCFAHMKKGPIKEKDSCVRKANKFHVTEAASLQTPVPDAMYTMDYLRLTISAADPMIVALIVEALFDIAGFEVLAINNKYLGEANDVVKTGSPSILINIKAAFPGLPNHQIVEVQIYIDQFLSLKKHQHKTYEFSRSLKVSDYNTLLRPIYKPVLEEKT